MRLKVPHTLFLLFAMIVLALVLTWVLPSGAYDRVEDEGGHEVVVSGTFHRVDDARTLTPWDLLKSVPQGFAAAQGIIFFVFIVGGAFGVLRETGAVAALIAFLLDRLRGRPLLLIAGGIFVFAAGSSTIGMAEEYIPFVPVLLALCIGLGLDAVTAVGILCVGYGLGYGVAAFNPFTVLVAQEVSGLAAYSGTGYRLALAIPILLIGIHHVWSYSRKITADPSKSLTADIPPDPSWKADTDARFTAAHVAVIVATLGSLGLVVYGIKVHGWYLTELGAVFFGLLLVYALLSRLGPSRTARAFCVGAGELTTTALLIGFARAIQVVLNEGQVIDTIIHGIAAPLEKLGPSFAAVGMLLVQTVCNVFVPSGSGQAYITMPLMAPLSDLVGLERQVAVLAYQFGDGFTNILTPTSVVLMGILGIAKIPYDRWFRFIFPLILKATVAAALALMLAVAIGYR